jgi:hypothetical protein
VTSAATKRKRRQRTRDKALLYSRDDWRLFLDPSTLPQKAGCHPDDLHKVVLKELVDNQLDATGEAYFGWDQEEKVWVISGASKEPRLSEIPKLFCVNRPLVSSKLKRNVSRGLLGNGLRVVMGAVYALNGSIVVTLRGRRLSLAVNPSDGSTTITRDEAELLSQHGNGMSVRISLGQGSGADDERFAREAIYAADKGKQYSGPSSPWWYGARDFLALLHAAPASATVGDVVADLGLDYKDERQANTLSREDAETILERLRAVYKQVPPEKLGRLGADAYSYAGYGCKLGTMTTPAGAIIPYVVEVWADAKPSKKKGMSQATFRLFLNRTPALARLYGSAVVGYIKLGGCAMDRWIELKSAQYECLVSIVTPYVQLSTDGKEPVLRPFGDEIEAALRRACNAAYRAMEKPPGGMEIKEAAYAVMEEAYLKASGGGKLHATARQIMYAARGPILTLTGKQELNDHYFTQKLLPDFLEDYADLTADWNVAYDARGHFIEPHTYREIGLGTIEVRAYLEREVKMTAAVSLSGSQMYPTHGPLNRYETISFIEKEGFTPLLESTRIAERFDVGIASSKGMSVTALRMLLDELSETGHLKKVLILHDFDVYGFSIFGTLFTDTRRYKFRNKVRVIDIGLRLEDVEEMGLDPEPYEPKNWAARVETLRRHGATQQEIEFLRNRRVELNAMTAPQFIAFLERKLAIYAEKVVPEKAVIEAHARRIWEQLQAAERCKAILEAIHAEAPKATLPPDLIAQIKIRLAKEPALSWDQALAGILSEGT